MSESAIPTTMEDAEARAIAAKAGLAYREAGAVAVDPRALAVLPGAECRKLRAVPLSGTAGSAVIGLSDPSEERLAAIIELTGPGARFVVLAERTLDALLHSRIFNAETPVASFDEESRPPSQELTREVGAPPAATDTPAMRPEPTPAPRPSAPEPPRELAPLELDRLVGAVVAALEPKFEALAAASPDPRLRRSLPPRSAACGVRLDSSRAARARRRVDRRVVGAARVAAGDRDGARRVEAKPARREGAPVRGTRRERSASAAHSRTRGRGRGESRSSRRGASAVAGRSRRARIARTTRPGGARAVG